MKQLAALARGVPVCAAIFFVFSCASDGPVRKYPKMVADMDPVSVGTIEAQFSRMFSSRLDKNEIEVIFYPRLNTVALQFRYEYTTYRQFWDEEGRRQFTAALNNYKKGFEERSLIEKYSQTRGIYGRVKGQAEWEAFRYAKTHTSSPAIELGYRFWGESPFFSTLMRSARAEDDSADGARFESQQISMYFTRTQAGELEKIFDQAYLLSFIKQKDIPTPSEPAAADAYREFEGES